MQNLTFITIRFPDMSTLYLVTCKHKSKHYFWNNMTKTVPSFIENNLSIYVHISHNDTLCSSENLRKKGRKLLSINLALDPALQLHICLTLYRNVS